MEEKKGYLHGTLLATIFHASQPQRPSPCFNCLCLGDSNPSYHVSIKIGKTTVAETRHDENRVWNQTLRILCSHSNNTRITLSLKNAFTTLGELKIPAKSLLSGEEYAMDRSNKLGLVFRLKFFDAQYENGDYGVTFPVRRGCSVVLYQDAHHGKKFRVPPVVFGAARAGQESRRPRRVWEDVYRAISGAKWLVYIAGWSLNPKIVLVRDPETDIPEALGIELGQLLKRKAEEGVPVRIMIWDDETSLHALKNQGIMNTHDEQSFEYFKHTKVICTLCPRLHNHLPTVFTHHQKTITTDANITQLFKFQGVEDDGREIISFIGGLDLCDGRYDTEEHSLFRTLNTQMISNDFYQINFPNAELQKGGPREPWHDAHSCVIGEAARDILANFEQRWAKQCDPSLLVPLSDIHTNHHYGSWNVQVFRSIDKLSVPATSLPEDCTCERSIHDAYVTAIRRAKRFIYIENQYFIGGSHLWDKDQDSGCTNLIPVEIGLKVASKIRANERFSVYIMVPMWPEGMPESGSVQTMLHWTRRTMAMMYQLIGDAIRQCGARTHPTDYLNFFCLGNREERRWGEYVPPDSPPHKSNYWNAQNNRRFMIYIHSKIMIVDDEYILIGSANLNERSMAGDRDTEIAIGCYQPKYTGREGRKYGDIHKYRISLWYEHTTRMDEAYLEPQTLDCVRLLRRIGKEMWDVYNGEAIVDMKDVHLISYPVQISQDGKVGDLDGTDGTFPDTTALIKGKRSRFLPPVFTA